DMRAVVLVVTATLVLGGVGMLVVARYAPATRVAAVQVGPCEVQAIDASTPPCASDPRLAGLGALFTHAPFRGFGCIKPAPSSSAMPSPAASCTPSLSPAVAEQKFSKGDKKIKRSEKFLLRVRPGHAGLQGRRAEPPEMQQVVQRAGIPPGQSHSQAGRK